MNPLVSVIVPAYNAESYVVETLDGVSRQSCGDWELILVDDGSTDRTAETVEGYLAARPGRMRIFSHPHGENRGTSASRNLGLQQARGELVCFLDADDVWHPEFLASLVAIYGRFPDLAMAYAPCIYWYPERGGNPAEVTGPVQNLGRAAGTVAARDLLKIFLEDENTVPSPSGVMMRRDRVVEAGGWEESFRGMFDDQALYAKLLVRGGEVFLVDRPLYHYRQHAASLCRTALRDNRLYESRRYFLGWLGDYLEGLESQDAALLKKVAEQRTLLEIRHRIDLRFGGAGSRLRAAGGLVRDLAELKKLRNVHINGKVIRYGLSYLAARLLPGQKA